jgi:alcohol dehydrogenase class IV
VTAYPRTFTWHDGDRTIRFGRGALADAPQLIGEDYVLFTTDRAAGAAPQVVAGAEAVHLVAPGEVARLADALIDARGGSPPRVIAALGGGRVIDTAKAVGAATGAAVAAIPTTLSAAEMTRGHRHATRTPAGTPGTRPRIVVNDPSLSASQPPQELAASAANALAHAVDGAATITASPVPALAAREAVRLTAAAYAGRGEPGREALALAALLGGYTIDAAQYGLHHVMAQTLRAVGGASHGAANAAMLPFTSAALRARAPEVLAELDEAAGEPVEALARRLAREAGIEGIRSIGVPEERLGDCAEAAARRPDLALTPPAADAEELLRLYRQAW